MITELKVTSHVGRALLASAGFFKTAAAATWEYVVNSLQYVDRGTVPVVSVQVDHRAKTITIIDNGRGMDAAGLAHFFTMHGENLDRRAGLPGRGKFGCGKSAAFGVARRLDVRTVRGGLLNEVVLTLDAIRASTGDDIPVEWLVRNERTAEPNGTTVTIAEIVLEGINTAPIVDYIERHLGAFRGSNPQVAVNSHVCEYREPAVALVRTFTPSPRQARVLGDVTLTVKVALAPLPSHLQGIAVSAGAYNVVAVETAGLERKEYGSQLFGDVDVPALEEPCDIEPYDASRNLQLNPNHPVVRVLLEFIGSNLEAVRAELAAQDAARQSTGQARRLAAESARIAALLNRDFATMRERLQVIRAVAIRVARDGIAAGHAHPAGHAGHVLTPSRDRHIEGATAPAHVPAHIRAPESGPAEKGRGLEAGFGVEYRAMGKDEGRSKFVRESMTILINLDHPVMAAALAHWGESDPAFRRLSYEIAFSEYTFALGYAITEEDPNKPADDLLYDLRSTLDRVSRAAVELYQ